MYLHSDMVFKLFLMSFFDARNIKMSKLNPKFNTYCSFMFSFSPENTRVSTYINTNLSCLKCAVRLAHCGSLIHFLIGPSLILMKKVNTATKVTNIITAKLFRIMSNILPRKKNILSNVQGY